MIKYITNFLNRYYFYVIYLIIKLKGEQLIADQILDIKFWKSLWSKVEESLDSGFDQDNLATDKKEDLFQQEKTCINQKTPEWRLISPFGYLDLAKMTLRIMTMSTQNCVYLIAKDTSHMFDVLSYILSSEFVQNIKQR